MQNNIPGYERWACNTREAVKEREKTRDVDDLERLNRGARAAFEGLSRRVDDQKPMLDNTKGVMENVLQRMTWLEERMEEMMACLQQVVQQQQQIVQQQQQQQQQPHKQPQQQGNEEGEENVREENENEEQQGQPRGGNEVTGEFVVAVINESQ